jgi:hypothetical protein
MVKDHLDALDLDDQAIAQDRDLQTWYLTLTKILPNSDPHPAPLDRARLVELCAALMWNNVIHEVCGDMSPIVGSKDPDNRAIINLERFVTAIADGTLTTPVPTPSMAEVFVMDQASFTSRFNVGGNNMLTIDPDIWIDDPKLSDAVKSLQEALGVLNAELEVTNNDRPVRFARMQPSNWEASISF